MKFFKSNFKLVMGLILGAILTGGIVYAATTADKVSYTRQGTNIGTVEGALNDLYSKQKIQNNIDEYLKQFGIYLIFYDGEYYNTDKFQVNICSGQLQEDKSIITNKNDLERRY